MSRIINRGRSFEIEELDNGLHRWTGQAGLCYPDENGVWHKSDCSIVSPVQKFGIQTLSEPEEFTLTCDTIEFPVAFSSFASGGQKIRTRDNKCFVVMRAQDVYDVQGTVADNKVLYEGAWDDSDLEFYATPEGLVKNITLHKRPAINTWTFEIEHFGLGMVEGDKEITWNRDGEEIWRTRKPWASDAENNYIEGTLTVRRDGGRIFYDVSIDPDWLDKAIYPVLVDPSTTLTPSTADAEIRADNPNANYGANSQATIYIDRTRALFRFSKLPSGIVNSATLELSLLTKPSAGDFWAYKVTHQDWVESEVTWKSYKSGYSWTNFGGDYVTSNPGAGTATVTSSAIYFDVNEIVADAISNNIDANFIIISSVHGVVYTREYATASRRPKLTIDYTSIVAPTVTTDSASSISATGATLNGTLSDDGGEACTCSFQWGLTTSYGNTTVTSSKTTGQTFANAISDLTVNTLYNYRSKAVNSAGTSYGTNKTFYTLAVVPETPSLKTGGTTSLTFQWTSNNPSGTSFAPEYREFGVTTWITLTETTNTEVLLSGLAQGTVYEFRVRSKNGAGVYSSYTSIITASTNKNTSSSDSASLGLSDYYSNNRASITKQDITSVSVLDSPTSTQANINSLDSYDVHLIDINELTANVSDVDNLFMLLKETTILTTNRTTTDTPILDSISKIDLLEAETSGLDPPGILLTDKSSVGADIPSSDSAGLSITELSSLSTFIGPSESSKLGLTESAVVLVVTSSSDSPSLSLSDKAGVGGTLPLADSLLAFFSEEASIYSKDAVSDALTVSFTKSARISISSLDINNIVLSKITKITANTFDKDTFNIITGEKTGISTYGFDELIVSLSESKTTNATTLKSDSGTVSLTETPWVIGEYKHKDGVDLGITESTSISVATSTSEFSVLSIEEGGDASGDTPLNSVNTISIIEDSSLLADTPLEKGELTISISDIGKIGVNFKDGYIISCIKSLNIEAGIENKEELGTGFTEVTQIEVISSEKITPLLTENFNIMSSKFTSDFSKISSIELGKIDGKIPVVDTYSIYLESFKIISSIIFSQDLVNLLVSEISNISGNSPLVDSLILFFIDAVHNLNAQYKATEKISLNIVENSKLEIISEDSFTLTCTDMGVISVNSTGKDSLGIGILGAEEVKSNISSEDNLNIGFIESIIESSIETSGFDLTMVGLEELISINTLLLSLDSIINGLEDTALLSSDNLMVDSLQAIITETAQLTTKISIQDEVYISAYERREIASFQKTSDYINFIIKYDSLITGKLGLIDSFEILTFGEKREFIIHSYGEEIEKVILDEIQFTAGNLHSIEDMLFNIESETNIFKFEPFRNNILDINIKERAFIHILTDDYVKIIPTPYIDLGANLYENELLEILLDRLVRFINIEFTDNLDIIITDDPYIHQSRLVIVPSYLERPIRLKYEEEQIRLLNLERGAALKHKENKVGLSINERTIKLVTKDVDSF